MRHSWMPVAPLAAGSDPLAPKLSGGNGEVCRCCGTGKLSRFSVGSKPKHTSTTYFTPDGIQLRDGPAPACEPGYVGPAIYPGRAASELPGVQPDAARDVLDALAAAGYALVRRTAT